MQGLNPDASTVVEFGSDTGISCLESDPTTSSLYPVIILLIALCCSSVRDVQEKVAVVGNS